MTLFWGIALGLTLLALLFILLPLLRVRAADTGDWAGAERAQVAVGISVYRRQWAELAADYAAGTVSQSEYQAACVDLQRNLLEMVPVSLSPGVTTGVSPDAPPGARRPVRSQRRLAGAMTLVLLPSLAVGLYLHYGAGAAAIRPALVEEVAESDVQDPAAAAETALEALVARLENNPEDAVGWALLGRMQLASGRMPAAAQAYSRALSVGGDQDADILLDYADLLATMRSGNLEGRPRDLIQRALRLDPDHPKGLWLAGTAAFRSGDYAATQDYWTRLAQQLVPQSETWAMVQANLAEVASRQAGQP